MRFPHGAGLVGHDFNRGIDRYAIERLVGERQRFGARADQRDFDAGLGKPLFGDYEPAERDVYAYGAVAAPGGRQE
jgi:hypothetical protein